MQPAEFRAVYLSSDDVYIRAYVEADKDVAAAWAGSPFPVNGPKGAKLLKDWHTEWWPRTRRYALCRTADDQVVGGVTISVRNLVGEFIVKTAPWLDDSDQVRAAAFRLIVPYLSEEWGLVSVTGHVGSDEPACRATAEDLGMSHQATMREFFLRPGGDRADDLLFQKLGSISGGVDA